MNDKSHSAVNTLIDQAINKVVQTIDTSITQAVIHGAKLVAGNNGNAAGDVTPIIGALACDFDACISPWMEAIREELREAAAMRLLYRADRLEWRGTAPVIPPPKPTSKPEPSPNGKPQNGKPLTAKPQSGKPQDIDLKGGVD
jgi:hypothetical protein